MARIFLNDAGFKILEVPTHEWVRVMYEDYGHEGDCDACLSATDTAYYVAAINRLLCRDCLKEFLRRPPAMDDDDREEEAINFKNYCLIFGVQ